MGEAMDRGRSLSLGRLLLRLWRALARRPPAALPEGVGPGARVRLRTPLASAQTVWIPAGALGIVVGWDAHGRRVNVELDTPRTVVTVPWDWVEPLPEARAPA